ncbi:MFS transporter [Devosia aurantiaca]|uniref:MFS transporter n=1 Tax=Devosia aurantiaca TaxID=2714858 RepID=A0A6M1SNK8_9HYPH|nr:MFS transporter [Devosia aurantiaca]NGP18798.1 MFS transporter [Devosia aurantiaca]
MTTSPPADVATTATRKERLVIVAVMLALFMAALEQTIVGPAMGDIARDLGGGSLLSWVATAYLLAATASSPILGAIADLRGRRLALFACVSLFLLGSVLAAMATSLEMLVAARIVQGAGAGGLTSLPFVVIADKVPMYRRAAYSAYISTIYAVASIFGPVAGGFLADYVHWTAIFWINVPIALLVIVAVAVLFEADHDRLSRRTIDYLGALLLIAATTSSVLWLNAVTGTEASLLPSWMLAPLALAAWGGFAWRMLRAATPLVPLSVLTERTILLSALGLLCCQGSNIGMAVYLPLYYQNIFGFSASEAGFAILGLLGGIMSGAYIPPQLLRLNPHYKPLVVGAAAFALFGALSLTAVLAFMPTLVGVEIATIALGLGIGSAYPIFTLATQNAAGPTRMGAAIGVLGFMRAMGGTIGVAVVGAVAVASGLTEAVPQGQAGIPMWTISLVASGLLAVCLLALSMLPPRALEGYAKAGSR